MIDETVQVAFRPLKSAGQYRQYYLPLTLDGAIENLDILTDSWEEKDWIDLSFSGIVEDENSVAELERRLRSEKAQRIRIIEIERSDVQPLPGIISQPIVEKFLEIWKEREPDDTDHRAYTLWLKARQIGLEQIKNVMEAKKC